jgi:HEPN domain-containing protein
VLLGLLEDDGLDLPVWVREAVRLNQYAVAARYPGVVEPVEPEEYEEAFAEATVVWVSEVLPGDPNPPERGELTGEADIT